MLAIKELQIKEFKKVLEVLEPECGLHAFIALHDTRLGPSLGGVRMYSYQTREQALEDVLRLAKGMTYKSAVIEAGLGGGKSVIIGNPEKKKTPRLLKAFAEAVNHFKGSYIAAEDVGTTPEDMLILFETTPYVSALPTKTSSGDPSRFTAWGVFRGMQAIGKTLWDSPSLCGKTIAIQGLGSVGSKLANRLFWEGANLIVTDIDPEKADETARIYGAKKVAPDQIFEVPCDIFAPCAMGAILNQKTIPKLQCKAVAGAANNQLFEEKDGLLLQNRNILYAPDFVVNAGGLINAAAEFEPGGYNPTVSRDKVTKIYDTLMIIFERAQKEDLPTSVIANELAEYKLKHGVGKRTKPIKFVKKTAGS
jgi:leucine dehydrogenase